MAEEAPLVGESATCPVCGTVVLQKQMIPVLPEGAADGGAHAYLCVTCARARIDTSQTGATASPTSGEPPAENAGAPT